MSYHRRIQPQSLFVVLFLVCKVHHQAPCFAQEAIDFCTSFIAENGNPTVVVSTEVDCPTTISKGVLVQTILRIPETKTNNNGPVEGIIRAGVTAYRLLEDGTTVELRESDRFQMILLKSVSGCDVPADPVYANRFDCSGTLLDLDDPLRCSEAYFTGMSGDELNVGAVIYSTSTCSDLLRYEYRVYFEMELTSGTLSAGSIMDDACVMPPQVSSECQDLELDFQSIQQCNPFDFLGTQTFFSSVKLPCPPEGTGVLIETTFRLPENGETIAEAKFKAAISTRQLDENGGPIVGSQSSEGVEVMFLPLINTCDGIQSGDPVFGTKEDCSSSLLFWNDQLKCSGTSLQGAPTNKVSLGAVAYNTGSCSGEVEVFFEMEPLVPAQENPSSSFDHCVDDPNVVDCPIISLPVETESLAPTIAPTFKQTLSPSLQDTHRITSSPTSPTASQLPSTHVPTSQPRSVGHRSKGPIMVSVVAFLCFQLF